MPVIALRPVEDADLDALFDQMRDPEGVRMAAFTAENPDDRHAFDAHRARSTHRHVAPNADSRVRAGSEIVVLRCAREQVRLQAACLLRFPGVLLPRWPMRACCYPRGSAAAARSRATDPATTRAEPTAIRGLRRITAAYGASSTPMKLRLPRLIDVAWEKFQTTRLRQVELVRPRSVIGKNTVEALQSGLVYGFAGQVDGLVRRIIAEIGPVTSVVATGGLAPVVVPDAETITHHEPDLTLLGLRLVYEHNL